MEEITLQALLEAGCHFGHKAERWHPKASAFIYTKKDGIHIIDLAKTKTGLEAAGEYVKSVAAAGGEVLFVGTKRQASGIVKTEASAVGAPYFSDRWIGGFLTNWDQIRKNIDKINRMEEDQKNGGWKKFPKHEQVKMSKYLSRIKIYYGGVLTLKSVPQALFIVDVRKEIAAVREGIRRGVTTVAVVDTNSDPTDIDYVIPANDDAVGSVTYIVRYMALAYREGKDMFVKQTQDAAKEAAAKEEAKKKLEKTEEKPVQSKDVKPQVKVAEPAKKAEVKKSEVKKAAAKAAK